MSAARPGTSSRVRRAVSGALLLVMLGSVVAAGSAASPPGHVVGSDRRSIKAPTVRPVAPAPGAPVTVTGKLAQRLERPIVLQARGPGQRSWRSVARSRTRARGTFRVRAHASHVAGTWEYRVRAPRTRAGRAGWLRAVTTPARKVVVTAPTTPTPTTTQTPTPTPTPSPTPSPTPDPDVDAPDAPTGVAAAAVDGQVEITWTTPSATDVAAIVVRTSESADGPWTEVEEVGASVTSIRLDVEPNRTWWFTLLARDDAGNVSLASEAVFALVTATTQVDDFSPSSGPATGMSRVTITGRALQDVATVEFDGVPAHLVSRTHAEIVVQPPPRLPGPASLEVELLGGERRSLGTYEYVEATLPNKDLVLPRTGTTELHPADIQAVTSYATGDHAITLVGQRTGLESGDEVYLHPGHPDASTGLAARVVSASTDEQGRTVLDVRQVALDQVLAARDFSVSAEVSEPFDEDSGALSRLTASSSVTGTEQKVLSFRRSWVDCEKLVGQGTDNERYEPIPDTEGTVQANFTIANLRVDVVDRSDQAEQLYRAVVRGEPTLSIVANFSMKARCRLKPALVAKATRRIPVGDMVLTLSPDASVTFSVEGKAVITKRTSFMIGLQKHGDEPAQPVSQMRSLPATISGSASVGVKVRVGFDTSLLYKGVVGLYTIAGATAEVAGTYEAHVPQFCVRLKSGFSFEVGAKLDYFVGTWRQPLLGPFDFPVADESACLPTAGDPDTEIVLDPTVGDNPEASYIQVTPVPFDSPFPTGAITTTTSGDSFTLMEDITLESGKRYVFHRGLDVPEGVTLRIEPGAHVKLGHCYWTIWLPAGPCLSSSGGLIQIGSTGAEKVIITSVGDDSLDGDTDGDPVNPAGYAPIEVHAGGVLAIRSAEMRFTGVRAQGGALFAEDVAFSHGAGVEANWASGTVDRIVMGSTAGSFVSRGGSGVLKRSRLASGVTVGGDWTVEANDVLGDAAVTSAGVRMVANRIQNQSGAVRGVDNGSGAEFTGNLTTSGEQLIVDASGILDTDVTWRPGVTYRASDVRVPPTASLTLAAGTVVKGSTRYNAPPTLAVQGTLRVQGTATAPVVLTSVNDASVGADTSTDDPYVSGDAWAGIALHAPEGSTPTLVMRHAVLRDAASTMEVPTGAIADLDLVSWEGGGPAMIKSFSPLLTIDDSTFSSATSATAVSLYDGGTIRNSTFSATTVEVHSPTAELDGIVFAEQAGFPLLVSSAAAPASVDARYADGSEVPFTIHWFGNHVYSDVTWPGDRTYLVTHGLTIDAGATLTIDRGAIVKLSATPTINVRGTLDVRGTLAQPVTFAHGLASIGADVSVHAAEWNLGNYWSGVVTGAGSTVSAEHLTVLGTGQFVDAADDSTLRLDHLTHVNATGSAAISARNADLEVVDSVFRHDFGTVDVPAIRAAGSTVLARNLFVSTTVTHQGTGTTEMRHNRFRDVVDWRVLNQGTNAVDARENWWGDAEGPTTGRTYGEALTSPWCLDEECSTLSAG